jgi:hypothetical protein
VVSCTASVEVRQLDHDRQRQVIGAAIERGVGKHLRESAVERDVGAEEDEAGADGQLGRKDALDVDVEIRGLPGGNLHRANEPLLRDRRYDLMRRPPKDGLRRRRWWRNGASQPHDSHP